MMTVKSILKLTINPIFMSIIIIISLALIIALYYLRKKNNKYLLWLSSCFAFVATVFIVTYFFGKLFSGNIGIKIGKELDFMILPIVQNVIRYFLGYGVLLLIISIAFFFLYHINKKKLKK